MTKRIRSPQVGRNATKEIPEDNAPEPAIVPSATAVAAEALATGVVPLETFVGDETPAGDMPSPDQNQVDDLGRALGVQEEDSGALRTSSEILERRDRHRGYLDVPEPNPETRRR